MKKEKISAKSNLITEENIHTYENPLKGKTCIISGGTTGIGRAAALLLASYGVKLIIFGRHKKELSDALSDIEQACSDGGEVIGMICDQADSGDVKKVFKKAEQLWKTLDFMLNNAALAADGILDMKPKDLRYIINSNLTGYIECAMYAAQRMKKQGGGHIINIGSMSADEREAGSSVYVATKSAIQGFTESIRKELNPGGIKISLIEPGRVGTDMQEEPPQKQRKMEKDMEMLKTQDIAVAVYYILTQPARCDVVEMKIRPVLQII